MTGRKSDPGTTYDAGPIAEPCIKLADMDFIMDISSAVCTFILVGMPIKEISKPVVNLIRSRCVML